jgi:L-ascorbate metabolism protein UlaG (beta-lactamase superfamily)
MSLQHWSLEDIARQKPHHGNGCFTNPFSSEAPGGFSRVLKWKMFAENKFSDQYSHEQVAPVSIDWKPVKSHNGLSITFINHASVMIKDRGTYYLVDPIFNGISFFIKDFTPLVMDPAQLPRPDYVLVTHGHYDHLNVPTLKSLGKDPHFITPLGYDAIIKDIAPHHLTRLDWVENLETDSAQITLLPCNHWTMRNPLVGPNRSLWGSYLLRTASGTTIYISGDTAYYDGFRAIGEMVDIDIAIICVGAYEPRWFMKGSHMNPAETVQAFQELGAKQLLLTHWGTFRLGDEPVFLPPIQVKEEMKKAGLSDRLIDITHGETFFL